MQKVTIMCGHNLHKDDILNTSVLRLLALRVLRTLRIRTRAFGPRRYPLEPRFWDNFEICLLYIHINNKYLPHVVDNVIFGIRIPNYP